MYKEKKKDVTLLKFMRQVLKTFGRESFSIIDLREKNIEFDDKVIEDAGDRGYVLRYLSGAFVIQDSGEKFVYDNMPKIYKIFKGI